MEISPVSQFYFERLAMPRLRGHSVYRVFWGEIGGVGGGGEGKKCVKVRRGYIEH